VEVDHEPAFHVLDLLERLAPERSGDVVDQLAQKNLAITTLQGDLRIGAGDDGRGLGHVDSAGLILQGLSLSCWQLLFSESNSRGTGRKTTVGLREEKDTR
jgi:hypothetical protein